MILITLIREINILLFFSSTCPKHLIQSSRTSSLERLASTTLYMLLTVKMELPQMISLKELNFRTYVVSIFRFWDLGIGNGIPQRSLLWLLFNFYLIIFFSYNVIKLIKWMLWFMHLCWWRSYLFLINDQKIDRNILVRSKFVLIHTHTHTRYKWSIFVPFFSLCF